MAKIPMLRLQLAIFAALLGAFAVFVYSAQKWGEPLAAAAYRPVLLRTARADLAALKFGSAEESLVRALKSTPVYAHHVLDLTVDSLVVMPELSQTLLAIFANEDTGGAESVDTMRIHFARGEYDRVLDGATALEGNSTTVWQDRYLRALSLRRLGRWGATESATFRPLPPADIELEKLAPEIAYGVGALQRGLDPSNTNDYLRAVAMIHALDVEEATQQLEGISQTRRPPADLRYWQGVLAELRGDADVAMTSYTQAVDVDPRHLDAGTAYLRLQGAASN